MKSTRDFLKQISKNGLYIILFLCISAIGIAGYVMYHTSKPEVPVNQIVEEIPAPVVKDEFMAVDIPNVPTENKKVPESKKEVPVEEGPLEFVSAVKGKVINGFSGDELVKSKTFNDWRTHKGIDIAADEGSPVYAIAAGTIEKVYEDDHMGWTIIISHRDGIKSTYSNLMKGITAKIGQKVKGGDVIAGVGKSAIAEMGEESHLHLETTKNGEQIDPMSLIK